MTPAERAQVAEMLEAVATLARARAAAPDLSREATRKLRECARLVELVANGGQR